MLDGRGLKCEDSAVGFIVDLAVGGRGGALTSLPLGTDILVTRLLLGPAFNASGWDPATVDAVRPWRHQRTSTVEYGLHVLALRAPSNKGLKLKRSALANGRRGPRSRSEVLGIHESRAQREDGHP